MCRTRLLGLWIVLGAVASTAASAQTAYTTKTVNVRAGPSRDYPIVVRAPGGTPVSVAGCVEDWSWCDVVVGDDRGWVWAGNLEYPYQDRRVLIIREGGYIGLPIVPFVVGSYWDTYYRGRPWYGRRSYWIHRPPPVFRPPRPRPPGLRPPDHRPPVVRPRPPVVVRPRPPVVVRPQPRPGPQAVRPPPPPRPQPARPKPQPPRRDDKKPR